MLLYHGQTVAMAIKTSARNQVFRGGVLPLRFVDHRWVGMRTAIWNELDKQESGDQDTRQLQPGKAFLFIHRTSLSWKG